MPLAFVAPGLLLWRSVRRFLPLVVMVAACNLGSVDPEPIGPTEGDVSNSCAGACHGSGATAAPPTDTTGHTTPSSIGVGAHAQHLASADWHKRLECASCHKVPEQIGDPGHIDSDLPAEVALTGLGSGGAWDRNTQSCTNTYCHGATLSNTVNGQTGTTAGGTATEPVWTTVDGTQSQCGSCHGAPPPAPHPADPDCGKCHPTMKPGGGMVIAYPDLHIDGRLDVLDTQACDSCHGQNGQSAPPKDTLGNVATTARGVGAHAQHLATGSSWHAPIDCVQCHKIPAGLNDQGHVDSPLPAELTFGPLAGTASSYDEAAGTCSNTYCHGGGATLLKGGTQQTPLWTKVDGTQSQCGSCHGTPPPAPHPQNGSCGSCHPTMTPGDNTTITFPALHIDGKVDITADQPCDSCHGGNGNPAPPKDTTGGTTTDLRGVGAHRAHLDPSTWRKDIACDACHKVPTQTFQLGHIDTALPAEITFAPIAGNATWNGATCSNNYCHGAGIAGGTSKNPAWTVVTGAQSQCGSCHGEPPPAPHPQDSDCGVCHNTMVAGQPGVWADPSRHIDGNLDVDGDKACNTCHGSATSNAPPKDTLGDTATAVRGVGAHQQHLASTNRFKPVDCTDCHRVPGTVNSTGHIDTLLPAELTFSPRAGTTTVYSTSNLRCSNNYCHGSSLTGGTQKTPLWTKVDGTQATCSSCHGNPPTSPPHTAASTDCGLAACHPNVVLGNPTQFIDPTKHVDGTVDVSTNQACNACHGGTNNAPPKDTRNNTSTSLRGIGAHQSHLTPANWHRDVQCAECHKVPTALATTGHIDTALPAEVTFTGISAGSTWNGSNCSTYCHGTTLGAGGSALTPLWTKVDGTQSQCTSCHGDPPPSHAGYTNPTQCSNCHPGGTGGTFSTTAAAQHIDGQLQVTAVHPAGYGAREAHGFDFDKMGSSTCATAGCHGTALTGLAGTTPTPGPSCAKSGCHSVGAQWQTSCTFCHGTTGDGAPPQGVLGATAPTDKSVGAHAKHLTATALHGAWDCTYCHTRPSSALTPGHIDGAGAVVQAEVKYSTLNPAGTFTASTATCANLYCHGTGRTSAGTAVWTSTTALNCNSCHKTPAPGTTATGMSGEHDKHVNGERMACTACHQTVVNSTPAIIGAALHVNGVKDVKMPTGTWTATTKACSGLPGGCHGTKTW